MKYKVIKEVKLDKELDKLINTSAQCMLKLLLNRLCKDDIPNYILDEDFDINYDFSMYGEELMQMKEEKGYSNDVFKNSAERFVRKLWCQNLV